MSLFFLLNNFHFSLEVLGAIAFLTVAWLALDAFLLRKDFLTASRSLGFLFLSGWQIIHAFNFTSDLITYFGYLLYLIGLSFIVWNLYVESKITKLEFKAVLIIPALSALISPLNFIVTIGLLTIAWLSYRQYKYEQKISLRPFWQGFLFIGLGTLSSIFYPPDSLGTLWVIGHIFELTGFALVGWWVWSFLQLRAREGLTLILTSVTLFMAVVVSLTFSSILISRIETQTKDGLTSDVRFLDLTISGLKEEASAKTRILAERSDIKKSVGEENLVGLEKISDNLLQKEKLGFLTILNKEGDVLLRAHALSQREDNLSGERAVQKAQEGEDFVTIESSPGEGFSIRAASPLIRNDKIIGVIIAGFPLDNALADEVKKITGLNISVFEGNARVATTEFNPDQKTRSVGIKQVDKKVSEAVLNEGKIITLRTTIASRPLLASYLPLRDADDKIVGMISVAKPQKEIFETAQTTNRLTLVIVMVIMIILSLPINFVTKKLVKE